VSGQVSSNEGDAPGRRRPRAEGLLGGAAQPSAPRPERSRTAAPASVRRAALVVAVEAAAATALALFLLFLTLTSSPDSVGRALAEVVYVGLAAALLTAGAVGLWRMAGWSRGPVIAVQLFLGVLGYTAAFQADRPLVGVPILAAVALVLYLLATPEARLAFFDR
jgi:hypothetical protein